MGDSQYGGRSKGQTERIGKLWGHKAHPCLNKWACQSRAEEERPETSKITDSQQDYALC